MGVIMHNNILYGGGSVVEPNPQESATEQLETLGIDGDVYEVTDANAVHSTDVGVANGVAELDSNGKVPSSQLPSYVDDVVEYASTSAFPATGESGKIYVALDTNLTYRWSGTEYVEISPSLALGETSSTAYRGDRGKIAYDHSQSDHSGIKPAFTEAATRANIASGESFATLLGKIKKWFSDLKTVAFTGAYSDLSGTPTIPTVNDGTLTIQKNGSNVATFTANQSGNSTANITVPEVEEADTTDSTPYLYRASQNSGDRCYLRQLVGASFGVNQLVLNGNFEIGGGFGVDGGTAAYANNICTVTVTQLRVGQGIYTGSPYPSVVNGHKYLISYEAKFPRANVKCGAHIGSMTSYPEIISGSANVWGTYQLIINYDKTTGNYAIEQDINTQQSEFAINDQYQLKNFFAIDLTQMFGTAIADKAYTMEQTTAGSGVSWLKSYGFFTESYYPYNTGSLQSVQTSGKVNTEGNLFDAQQTRGGTVTDGQIVIDDRVDGWISTSDTVIPQNTTTLYVSIKDKGTYSGSFYPELFDENHVWIDNDLIPSINFSSITVPYNTTVTLPSNVKYIRLRGWNSNGGTAKIKTVEVCVSIINTEYEPYTTHTTLISPIDLRGVPKLVDNNIVYDGDVRDESGTVTRKYEHLNLGSLNYTYSNNRFVSTTALSPIATSAADTVCGIYHEKFTSWNSFVNYTGGNAMYIDYDNHNLYIKNPSYSDATTFKNAMNGVYLDYKKTTPTTEQTNPIQNPEIYNQFGWEQFIDDRSYPIPVGHNSEYVNLPDWLEDGYYKDFRQRVDETLPNAIDAVASSAIKVIAKNGEYDASVIGFNDMPNCSLSLDKGTYLILAWCYFTAYNIDTNKEYGCAICDSSNIILSYDGHRNRTESAEGYYGATSSTFILETITTDATVRKLRGYMCKTVTGNPIKGGIAAFKIS